MFSFGIFIGVISIICGDVAIGLKRIINPVGYWRYPVFRAIKKKYFNNNKKDLKILDVGSPKLFAVYLSAIKSCSVYATDLQDDEIFRAWKKYYNNTKKITNNKFGGYFPEFQDARELKYQDGMFDVVYAISVIEHIPEDGDYKAMKEIGRVLKKGGVAIIEVPFSNKYREEFLSKDVYERKFVREPLFYQRHYDKGEIFSRLILPSGLLLEDAWIFQEKLNYERLLDRLPLPIQTPLLFFNAILSIWNHKTIELKEIDFVSDGKAADITICLRKMA